MSGGTPETIPRFPWPILVVVALALLAYGLSLGPVLGAPLLAFLLLYLLYPYRRLAWVLRTLVAVSLALLAWLVARFASILFILGAALFFAYVLDPAVDFLQRRHLPRTLAVLVLLVPILAVLVLLLILLVPPILRQVGQLVRVLPDLVTGLQKELQPLLARLGAEELSQRYTEKLPQVLADSGRLVRHVLGITRTAGGVAAGLVLFPFLTFFVLRDYDRLRTWGASWIPPRYHDMVSDIASEMERLLGRWLRGILLVAVVVGVLDGLGLWALGVPYALALGALAGVMNLLPIIGFWVSFLPALVVAYAALGPGGTLRVVILYLAVSTLEAHLLQPRIVGGQVGLHPVVVLLALLVFGSIFGLVGALVAIPLSLVLAIVLRRLKGQILASDLYEDTAHAP